MHAEARRKKFAISVLVFASVLLDGRTGIAADQTLAADLPTQGTRWVYSYRDAQNTGARRTFTVLIAKVDGVHLQEQYSLDDGEIVQNIVAADQLRFMARPLSSDTAIVELGPYSLAASQRPARATSSYPFPAEALWRAGQVTYQEETVTVPAGTFATLRVQVEGAAPHYGSGTAVASHRALRFRYTAWYSRDTKRYLKSRNQTWNRFGAAIGDETTQLTAYVPGK